MASITWGPDVAETYDASSPGLFDAVALEPTIDLLVELAAGGPALEFAVGTGRVALPLSARGVSVTGIELSPHMAEQLRAKPGADRVPVTVGDMTTTRLPGTFRLVYLVWNTIMNVTTQEEQVAVFANAAAHLEPGGRFLVEVEVPQPHRLPHGDLGSVFAMDDDHVGIDTYDDPVGQILSSHHWTQVDGRFVHHSAPYRYVWPSELDLMGRVAGLRPAQRWAGWRKEPFTAQSTNQVTVFEKPV
jgi:ubiquinone/menaquinone biosynthesis C-methylase UbiE